MSLSKPSELWFHDEHFENHLQALPATLRSRLRTHRERMLVLEHQWRCSDKQERRGQDCSEDSQHRVSLFFQQILPAVWDITQLEEAFLDPSSVRVPPDDRNSSSNSSPSEFEAAQGQDLQTAIKFHGQAILSLLESNRETSTMTEASQELEDLIQLSDAFVRAVSSPSDSGHSPPSRLSSVMVPYYDTPTSPIGTINSSTDSTDFTSESFGVEKGSQTNLVRESRRKSLTLRLRKIFRSCC